MEIKRKISCFSFLTLIILRFPSSSTFAEPPNGLNDSINTEEIHVGAILDMASLEGKVVQSCISMAISDFYSRHVRYRTRVVVHTRDSEGEPLRALSAAVDLLMSTKAVAIIGGQTSLEAKLLAELGDKAKVPVISFSAPSPPFPSKYPYFVQVTEDEHAQAKAIAAFIESFKWKEVVFIYEETDNGRETIKHLLDSLLEKKIQIAYTSIIAPSLQDDNQITEELHKINTMQNRIFVVHVSHSLLSRLCLNAKRLGMMKEGYAWIMTAKSMNHFHSMDSSVIRSMQGVVGFKSYVSPSKELENFTRRWRKKARDHEPDIDVVTELSPLGLWAHDVIWTIANAVEKVEDEIPSTYGVKADTGLNWSLADMDKFTASDYGSMLLKEMLQSSFQGLSGDFQFIDRKLVSKTFEIVNVIGKAERAIGYWTAAGKLTRELQSSSSKGRQSSSSCAQSGDLEAIIWPGGSAVTPTGYMLETTGKRLRLGVPLKRGFTELLKVNLDVQRNTTTVTGFCVDVFKAAVEVLPYEVDFEFVPFVDAAGQPAGSYNDLVDQVYLQVYALRQLHYLSCFFYYYRDCLFYSLNLTGQLNCAKKKYDGAVGDITISANRSLFVDFTLPYTDLGVGMVARAPEEKSKSMWVFLKPFTADLWLSSAAFFLLTGFVVWVIERPINDEFQGSLSRQIGTMLYFPFSTLVFAHGERLVSNLSRFVVIVWVFIVFILTSSYSATLTSMLTVRHIQLNSRNIPIGYQWHSFTTGAVDSYLHSLNSSLVPLGKSEEDFARALSMGSVSAIIDEVPYIKLLLAKYPNKYYTVGPVKPTTNGFGFVFQKGSALARDMSRAIAKLREEGKLLAMENAWFSSQSTLTSMGDATENDVSPLTFESFRGLFLISGMSSALALVMSFMFRLHKKLRNYYSYKFEEFFKFIKDHFL